MIDAQVHPIENGAIVYDAALGINPGPDWFDPNFWAHQGAAHAASGGRGGVTFIETPAGPAVLRHYRRGGFMRHASVDRYLWSGEQGVRSFCEFHLLAHMLATGLPVPAPIAAYYQRTPWRYRADLIVRRIADAHTLGERLEGNDLDTSCAVAIGTTLARFHANGVWHADLNAHNILIDSRDTIWIIDFDRGRLRRPDAAWQGRNLARLRRSLEKLGAGRVAHFDTHFWNPLLAAYNTCLSEQTAELAQ